MCRTARNDTAKGTGSKVLGGEEYNAALASLAAAGHLGVVASHGKDAWLDKLKHGSTNKRTEE